jgi:hypothetical protein
MEPVVEIWQIRALFSQKLFVCVEIIFFRSKKCKNSSNKKNTG